jgi:hypothetical protein
MGIVVTSMHHQVSPDILRIFVSIPPKGLLSSLCVCDSLFSPCDLIWHFLQDVSEERLIKKGSYVPTSDSR